MILYSTVVAELLRFQAKLRDVSMVQFLRKEFSNLFVGGVLFGQHCIAYDKSGNGRIASSCQSTAFRNGYSGRVCVATCLSASKMLALSDIPAV
jgi:hypothetical protein